MRCRGFALCLLLVLAPVLAGCLDAAVRLRLTPQGRGVLETRLAVPARLAAAAPRRLDTIVFPPPRREQRMENGRRVIIERLAFPWLDVVATRRLQVEVEEIDHTLLGAGASTYQVVVRLQSLEGDLPDRAVAPGTELEQAPAPRPELDPAAARARRLLAASLGGHFLTVELELPGRVVRAWPVVLGSRQVEARVSGGRVSWRVPVAMMAVEEVRHNLTFRCRFKGRLAFRGPGQSKAATHWPSPAEERAAARAEQRP